MKRTGKAIYEEIKQLTNDKQEVGEALDSVRVRLGSNNAAYKVLLGAYKMAEAELNKVLKKSYEEPEPAPSIDIFGEL